MMKKYLFGMLFLFSAAAGIFSDELFEFEYNPNLVGAWEEVNDDFAAVLIARANGEFSASFHTFADDIGIIFLGRWFSEGDKITVLIFERLIDGKPIFTRDDWICTYRLETPETLQVRVEKTTMMVADAFLNNTFKRVY